MITKELFVKSIESLQKYTEWENKLYEVGIDTADFAPLQTILSSFLELLAYSCGEDYQLLPDFIYNPAFTQLDKEAIEKDWETVAARHPEVVDTKYTPLTKEELFEIFSENFTQR